MKRMLRGLLAVGCLFPISLALAAMAAHADSVLQFDGGIGVDPLTPAGGVDQLNVVRGVNPGGRAWAIRELNAKIYSGGSAVVRGEGLLFSSGDVIATRGPVGQVVATLACGEANSTATKYTTESAPLSEAGDFTIRGTLRGIDGNVAPLETVPCDNPLLLIRAAGVAGAGGWLAVGILDRDKQ